MVLSLAVLACLPTVGQQRQATPVVVSPVIERKVPESIRLVGTVRADRIATVASEVDGLVAAFEAEEGQFLTQGDVICQLNDEVAQLLLTGAQAELQQRQEELSELEAGTRKEELRRLEAYVAEAEARLRQWEFERNRIARLFEANQANPKEKHDADMEYLAAERRLNQAKAEYEMAVNGPRAEVIASARYAVAAQQAVVQRLERDFRRAQILAPFDGFIVEQLVEIGEWINAGGPVCRLVGIEKVKVRVDVPESAIAFAKPQAPALVVVEALGRRYESQIARVIPLAREAARSFPVEIDLANEDHALLPGMLVRAQVPAGPEASRLMVTKDAIVARGLEKTIFVIRQQEGGPAMAMPMNVTTGLEFEGLVEVQAAGLQAGDRVVSRANERLFGPTAVAPQTAAESEQPGGPGDRSPTASGGASAGGEVN